MNVLTDIHSFPKILHSKQHNIHFLRKLRRLPWRSAIKVVLNHHITTILQTYFLT